MLVVAVLALRNPKSDSTVAGSQTGTVTQSGGPTITRTKTSSGTATRSATSSTSRSAKPSTPRSSTSKSTPSTSTSTSRSGAIGSEPLVVLNQSGTTGLADSAAQRFRSGGWTVTSTDDNYINDVITTTAYYDPSVSGAQAAALALQRQFPTIKRVAERFSNLTAGPVVVVLTTDYTSS